MAEIATIYRDSEPEFSETLRMALRGTAVNVLLLTTRDRKRRYHGLAVTSAVPFSTQRPSMIVAVSHRASAYPAICESGLFCLNQIAVDDIELLDRFCQSDLRSSRFTSGNWSSGLNGLPYLETSTMSAFCEVQGEHVYEDQTVFVGRIEGVRIGPNSGKNERDPLIWMNGRAARLAGSEYA